MLKPGYKQTDLGVLPEEWEVVKIDDCLTLLTDFEANGSFESVAEHVKIYNHEEYSWYVRATDLENNSSLEKVKFVDSKSYKFLKKTSLFGNELLVTKRGEIGKVYFFKKRTAFATLAPNMYLLKLNEKVLPYFLYCYLKYGTGNDLLIKNNASSTLGALYKDDVKAILAPLPPPAEQQAIAEALGAVDTLLTAQQELLAKKRDLKQATQQALLSGERRLPEFEGEWELKTLGDVLKIKHGKSQHEVADDNGRYPILATGGIIGRTDSYLCNKPSVLIGRKGTIDSPQYMDQPFWTVDTLFYTEIIGDNSPKFIYYAFQLIDWYFYNEASGVPSLNASTIEKIEIRFPLPAEQRAIAAILSDMDAELEALATELAKTKALKQGLMQDLLTGTIRLTGGAPLATPTPQ